MSLLTDQSAVDISDFDDRDWSLETNSLMSSWENIVFDNDRPLLIHSATQICQ